ncbi:hypothetical protein HDE_12676 [Halotydeus destructor]|nr:hypothetical protein HDE_12676 [Halotydeus destructor]
MRMVLLRNFVLLFLIGLATVEAYEEDEVVEFKKTVRPMRLFEGETFQHECTSKTIYRHDSKPLPDRAMFIPDMDTGLVIPDLTLEDSGTYVCEISENWWEFIQLTVVPKPTTTTTTTEEPTEEITVNSTWRLSRRRLKCASSLVSRSAYRRSHALYSAPV